MITDDLTPAQFRAAFRTEQQCVNYIFRRKYPDGFRCPKCAHDKHYEIEHRGGVWECDGCGYQESAKAGTVFHRSKLPLVTWFRAIFELTISKGGISALELQHRLGIKHYRPAWEMLHKLRAAMGLRDENYELTAEVELDGAVFGKRATGTETKVYIAVESKTTRIGEKPIAGFAKARVVGSFNQDEIKFFATRAIAPLAEVKTDGGVEVNGVERGTDLILNAQIIKGDCEKRDKHLPWVHKLISNIKSSIVGTYHGVSGEYLQLYLDEYIYRFNRRRYRNQLQTRLITACVKTGPYTLPDSTT